MRAAFARGQDVVKSGAPVFMVEGLDNRYKEQASIVAMNLRAMACLPLMEIPANTDTPSILGILYLDSTKKMHSLRSGDRHRIPHFRNSVSVPLIPSKFAKCFQLISYECWTNST